LCEQFVAGGGQVGRGGQSFALAMVIIVVLKHFRTTLMFVKETLLFKEVVQNIIYYVKMNKSMTDDMKNEGLLIKGSNNYHRVDPRKEVTSLTTMKSQGQNPRAVKMRNAINATIRVTLRNITRSLKLTRKKERTQKTTTIGVATENNAELLLVPSDSKISDSWILVSGCTFHMCSNMD